MFGGIVESLFVCLPSCLTSLSINQSMYRSIDHIYLILCNCNTKAQFHILHSIIKKNSSYQYQQTHYDCKNLVKGDQI